MILTRQEHSITDLIFYIKPFDKITHNYSAKCPRKPLKAKFLPFGCITLLFLRPSVQVKYGQAVIVHLASAAALAVSLPAFTAGGRALCTLYSCTPAASWREEGDVYWHTASDGKIHFQGHLNVDQEFLGMCVSGAEKYSQIVQLPPSTLELHIIVHT